MNYLFLVKKYEISKLMKCLCNTIQTKIHVHTSCSIRTLDHAYDIWNIDNTKYYLWCGRLYDEIYVVGKDNLSRELLTDLITHVEDFNIDNIKEYNKQNMFLFFL